MSRFAKTALFIAAAAVLVGGASLLLRHAAAKAKPAAETKPAARLQPAPPAEASSVPVLYFVKNPEPAPPFLLRAIGGEVVSTAAWKGKVVLLNFWATWCPPCREEIPELIALQAQYKNQLQVVGFSEDEAPSAEILKFAQQAGINYPIVRASDQLVREYGGVSALPTSFVIDTRGRIVQKHVGLRSFAFYDTEVRALLGLPVNAQVKTFVDQGQIFMKNATELPGVSFAGLSPAQKKLALHRLNAESCACGCGQTLAQCRVDDTACPTSRALAAKVVHEVAHGAPANPAAAKAAASARN